MGLGASVRQSLLLSQHSLMSQVRFATKKAGGSSKNGRDSVGRRLGVKKFGGETVQPGSIIIRQRGRKYHEGENVGIGRDHTIYAKTEGWVHFRWSTRRKRQVVSVVHANPNIMSSAVAASV